MEKKKLFNEYEAMNDDGLRLSDEILKAIEPIARKYEHEGYLLRDMQVIIVGVASYMMSEHILMSAIGKRCIERIMPNEDSVGTW
jgi:hypothetical protein